MVQQVQMAAITAHHSRCGSLQTSIQPKLVSLAVTVLLTPTGFAGVKQPPGALQGKKDPEVKRKTIGAGFIEVFRDFAITLKTKHGIRPKYLVQVALTA